ncbi:hypothetical protein KUF71_011868 [Frankliniella fusca]|nr:hypothetical protein KUF71_011868 [Frankliniella fusca]
MAKSRKRNGYNSRSLGIRGRKIRSLNQRRAQIHQAPGPVDQGDGQVTPPPLAPAPRSPTMPEVGPASPATPRAPPRATAPVSTPRARPPPTPASTPSGSAGPQERPCGVVASTPVANKDPYENVFDGNSSPVSWEPSVGPVRRLDEAMLSTEAIEGRRCILYTQFIEQIKADRLHSPLTNCSFYDSVFVEERIMGFRSEIKYKCTMCQKITVLHTDKVSSREMDVNMAIVAGTVNGGGTFALLESIASSINMMPMTIKTYRRKENKLADIMAREAMDAMILAGQKELELAVDEGDKCADGVPYITVVVDGQWSKRSFGNKYDATSGSATIIGYRTGKVLFTGVKNKRCSVCEYAQRKNIPEEEVRDHACAKNYSGPSTGMEAELIQEGFKRSVLMHNLRFMKYIGDGDSSVEKMLCKDKQPYGATFPVQKIECKNHLLRNLKKSLLQISQNTHLPCPVGLNKQDMVFLRKLVKENTLRLATGVSCASEYRGRTEDVPMHHMRVANLRADILNAPLHTFGDHDKCAEYFCKTRQGASAATAAAVDTAATAGPGSASAPGPSPAAPPPPEVNYVPRLSTAGIWSLIMTAVHRLADKASSLVYNVSNNPCEVANSVIAQKVANKRPYLGGSSSYEMRVNAAALSLNTSGEVLRMVHKSATGGASPGKITVKCMERRKAKRDEKRRRSTQRKLDMQNGVTLPVRRAPAPGPDQHYGLQEESNQPPPADDPVAMQEELAKFKQSLQDSLERAEELKEMAQGTDEWLRERRLRLTAADFGEICKRKPHTSCRVFVHNKLYGNGGKSKEMQHGRMYEPEAKKYLVSEGYDVEECGLFIDQEMPFLGASPDGLIGLEMVLEIKCPYSAFDILTKEEAIVDKVTYLKRVNGEIKLAKDHSYYYQIQGQLHVTQRQKCLFLVYAMHWTHIEEIERDDEFWNRSMRDHLKRFYEEALLPEIVMPLYPHRRSRNDIREAPSILQAQDERRNQQERAEKEKRERLEKREEAKRTREVQKQARKAAAERRREEAEKKKEQRQTKRKDAEGGEEIAQKMRKSD